MLCISAEARAEIVGPSIRYLTPGSTLKLICRIVQNTEASAFIFWYHDNRMINYDVDRGINVSTEAGKTHNIRYFCLVYILHLYVYRNQFSLYYRWYSLSISIFLASFVNNTTSTQAISSAHKQKQTPSIKLYYPFEFEFQWVCLFACNCFGIIKVLIESWVLKFNEIRSQFSLEMLLLCVLLSVWWWQ